MFTIKRRLALSPLFHKHNQGAGKRRSPQFLLLSLREILSIVPFEKKKEEVKCELYFRFESNWIRAAFIQSYELMGKNEKRKGREAQKEKNKKRWWLWSRQWFEDKRLMLTPGKMTFLSSPDSASHISFSSTLSLSLIHTLSFFLFFTEFLVRWWWLIHKPRGWITMLIMPSSSEVFLFFLHSFFHFLLSSFSQSSPILWSHPVKRWKGRPNWL